MLYLEDFLEMIEHLPMEMREKFTDMREMDLQVQNSMDAINRQLDTFFKKCSEGRLKQPQMDAEFEQIKQEFIGVLDISDDKVALANNIYDSVERNMRKLDQELAKFKLELEADNAGITELLEKRSLELDKPLVNGANERGSRDHRDRKAVVSREEAMFASGSNLDDGAGSAASSPGGSGGLSFFPEAPLSAVTAFQQRERRGSRMRKNYSSTSLSSANGNQQSRKRAHDELDSSLDGEPLVETDSWGNGLPAAGADSELRYCVCGDVSYGHMIGCDNSDCPIEWFHYGCVGLDQAPRGKWYCPQCTSSLRRRGLLK